MSKGETLESETGGDIAPCCLLIARPTSQPVAAAINLRVSFKVVKQPRATTLMVACLDLDAPAIPSRPALCRLLVEPLRASIVGPNHGGVREAVGRAPGPAGELQWPSSHYEMGSL